MREDDEQVELLDIYLAALIAGADSPPPPNLDPQDALIASRLVYDISPPQPDPEFLRRLRGQILVPAKSTYSMRASETVIGRAIRKVKEMINTKGAFNVNRLLAPGIAAVVLAVLAVAVLVTSGNGGPPQTGGGDNNPPTYLTDARDSLPLYPGTVAYQTNIYSGGSFLDALYFVNAAPAEVSSFFERELTASGWTTLTAPTETTLPKDDKTSVSSWTYSAQRDDVTATISTMSSDKDPTLGSTQISIRVERLDQ